MLILGEDGMGTALDKSDNLLVGGKNFRSMIEYV